MALYSQEVTLVWDYFTTPRTDATWIKLLLAALFVNDTFSTATEVYCVYE